MLEANEQAFPCDCCGQPCTADELEENDNLCPDCGNVPFEDFGE